MVKWYHGCVLWSCKNMMHLEFFKNINFKWSNNWLLCIRHHSCAFVYITMLIFGVAPPCGHGLTFCWPICNTFSSENYHFQSHIVKFLLDNTVFYRKWLNLNTMECVLFYMYTAYSAIYNTLTCFTVVILIWLVNFIDYIEFKTLSPQYSKLLGRF